MLHLIDGYNVTKRDPATRNLPIEEQRLALETRLQTRARELIGTTDYLIVWDGAGGNGVARRAARKSSFTRRPTADDAIVERVRAARTHICVVTSDNGLAARCRAAASVGVDVKPSSILFADALMFADGLGDDGDGAAMALPESKPHGKGKAHARKKGAPGKRQPTTSRRQKGGISPEVGIPKGANKINEELKKIWGIED